MKASLFAVLLALSGGHAAAQSPTKEAYDLRATPLDDLSRELLLETGYVFRDDGKVWDKIADNAVRFDEMSYLLSRLAGARRLKALLELNLILNRSEGEKKLTDAERESVRNILRKHWGVFGIGTRKDFRSYFSVQELTEELDKIPPRFDRGSAMLMRDPDPSAAPPADRVAAPISVTAPPPAVTYAPVPVRPPEEERRAPAAEAPRQFYPRSVLTPFLEPLSLRRPSPFAPRARAERVPIDSPQANHAPVAAAAPAAPAPLPVIPAAPSMPPAIATLLGALAPVDDPRPMMSGGTSSAALPARAPAPAPPPAPASVPASVPATAAIVQQAPPLPPNYPTPPPELTPRSAPVTSAPPIVMNKPAAPTGTGVSAMAAMLGASPAQALAGYVPPPQQPVDPAQLGVFKSWTPASSPAGAPGAAATVPSAATPPVPAPPVVAVEAPKPAPPVDTTPAVYDAFIMNGPYGHNGQTILRMIAEKSPEFCRAILRRTVVLGAPLIVFDGARAGSDRRAGFAPPVPQRSAVIAVSAGPLLVERKKGLFSKTLIALPEDPRAWAEFGLTPPALDAFRRDAAAVSEENGPWGATRIYADRSRRGTYSAQEQAGELLERLLLLGLEREGFASSTYAARVWARAARLLFSARVAEDYGNDSFLDPDRKQELRDWLERGDESDDLLVASWSSSRGNVLDPRRGGPESQAAYERKARESCTRSLLADHLAEAARNLAARVRTLEALADADVITSSVAKAAAERAANEEAAARKALLASPPACDGRFGADEAGLHRSSALLAEVSRAERAFRERKSRGKNHE